MRYSLLIVIKLFLAQLCLGQHLYVKKYGVAEGLPDLEVLFLSVAPDGRLWIQTTRHICRYNGYEFECWDQSQTGIKKQLSSIFYLGDKTYFTSFHNETVSLSNKNFRKEENIISKGPSINRKGVLIKQDTLYVQDPLTFQVDTLRIDLGIFKKSSFKNLSVNLNNKIQIYNEDHHVEYYSDLGDEIDSLEFLKDDRYRIEMVNSNYYKFSERGNSEFIEIKSEDFIDVFLNRADKSLIFSYVKSGQRFLTSSSGIELGHYNDTGEGFVITDLANNLWVGNHSGLTRINPSIAHVSNLNTLGMIDQLHTIDQDSKGRMIFGGYKTGLCYYDGIECQEIDLPNSNDLVILPGSYTEGDFTYYFTSRKCELLKIKNLKVVNPNHRFTPQDNFKFPTGYYIKRLSNGNYALGTNSKGIAITDNLDDICYNSSLIDESKGLNLYNVLTISEDAKGRLWCGRASSGIGVYDQEQDTSVTWYREIDDKSSFGIISSIIDERGTLWLGCNDGLKNIQNIKDFNYEIETPFNAASIILNNINDQSQVGSLIETDEYIVAGSALGVTFINKSSYYAGKTKSFFLSYRGDIPGLATDQNGMLIDSENYLWITTDDGVIRFDLEHLPIDTLDTGINIGEINVGDSTLTFNNQNIILPSTNRNISIDLDISYNPSLSENLSFSSTLINDQGDTISSTSNVRDANLPRQFLQPGEYFYKIIAKKNNEAVWDKQIKIIAKATLIEMPLFWATAIGGIASLIIVLGYIIAKRRNDNLKNALVINELRGSRDNAKLQAIISSFNPHFINNSLHWIQSKHVTDPLTVTIIDRLSKNIEHLFKNTREGIATHSLREEIILVENYIKIQQIRFKDTFSYIGPEVEKISTLGDIKCILMQLQIHVENAIEHGLSNRTKSSYVQIELEDDEENVYIKVIDDGAGRDKANEIGSHGTQSGVKMLSELHDIYNRTSSCSLSQIYKDNIFGDHGTCVLITIPKRMDYSIT